MNRRRTHMKVATKDPLSNSKINVAGTAVEVPEQDMKDGASMANEWLFQL